MQEKPDAHASTSRSTTGQAVAARSVDGHSVAARAYCSAQPAAHACSPSPSSPPLPRAVPAPRNGRAHDHRGDRGHRNEVVLAGRVTAEPYVRELPSGDHLVTWRISVARPAADRRPNQPADPITCVSFRPAIEAATRGWRIGDIVRVSGALRRRFWRSAKGVTSVIEVEAASVALVESAAAGGGRRRDDAAAGHQPS